MLGKLAACKPLQNLEVEKQKTKPRDSRTQNKRISDNEYQEKQGREAVCLSQHSISFPMPVPPGVTISKPSYFLFQNDRGLDVVTDVW